MNRPFHSPGIVGGLCIVAFLAVAEVQATVIKSTCGAFDVSFYNNGDSNGAATGEQDWTAEQQSDVLASINTWTSKIGNTAARQVRLHMLWGSYDNLTLGTSYNPIIGDLTHAATATELAYREGDGRKYTGRFDAYIIYDIDGANHGWSFGSASPTSSSIDFRSVVTHEIGHTLGFTSSYSAFSDGWSADGITTWDSMLEDSTGIKAAADSRGTTGNFNETDEPVYFTGANAMAANGGQAVQVYAPSTYTAGASLCHLNGSSIYPDALMNPTIYLGVMHREPNTLEWAIMKDLGWTIVPEPGTWVMLLGMGIFLSIRFLWIKHTAISPV